MLVRFRVGFISNFFPLFPMYLLDRGYFEGTKSTSQQVLLSDEQDPKLKLGCLFSLLFMLLVHTPITSSFSQDIHSFASSWKRTVKSFRKCFRMFDSTAVLSVILKILKFNFQLRMLLSNCCPESLKFDRKMWEWEFGLFEFEKILPTSSFNRTTSVCSLSTKIPLAYLLPAQQAIIFYLLPTRTGKKKNRRAENFAVAAANRLNFRPLSL